MSLVTLPRLRGDRGTNPFTRLGLECLESRTVPATLISTDFTQSSALPADAEVLGASTDGRYIVFQSKATNVIQGQIDQPNTNDIFWQDTATAERRLVSAERKSAGKIAIGAEATVAGGVANAVISADGLSVAFVSKTNASRFDSPFAMSIRDIADNANSTDDVFLWNVEYIRQAVAVTNFIDGTPDPQDFATLMSRLDAGTAFGNTSSAGNPAISADGKVVAFVSRLQADLVDGNFGVVDTTNSADVFFTRVDELDIDFFGNPERDLEPGLIATYFERTVLGIPTEFTFGNFGGDVSVDPLGRYLGGDGFSYAVMSAISPNQIDGAWSPSSPGTVDLYYIRQDPRIDFVNDIALVSTIPGSSSKSANGKVTNAIIASSASDVVVFSATVPGTGSNVLVLGYKNQNGGGADLYRRSVSPVGTSGVTELISAQFGSLVLGSNGALDQRVGAFAVSPDGSKVVFGSSATNLVSGISDTNGANDVFLWNVDDQSQTAVSVTPSGTQTGNAASSFGRVSSDGSLVAFESLASNLSIVSDTNQTTEVFVRQIASGATGLASVSSDLRSTGNGPSTGPIVAGLSGSGVVYFNSVATNLDAQYSVVAGTRQFYSARLPLPGLGVSTLVAVSGGRNGFVGLGRFDAAGNLIDGTPVIAFPGFTGEIRTAVGDLTGDGIPDIIAASGPGGGPRIKVIDGVTLSTVYDFYAFESNFTGGLYVAAADFNGDGITEIIVGAGEGGGPRVQIYDGATLGLLMDQFVLESTFRGGVRVAAGDYTGDGIPDLIVGAGEGGGPRVVVFNGAALPTLIPVLDFFAFEPSLRNGVYVSSGDFNGDGRADILVGAGPGGAPRVSVFDAALADPNTRPSGTSPYLYDFYAFEEAARSGVRVTSKTVDGDSVPDIVVGAGAGTPRVRTYSGGNFSAPLVPSLLQESLAFGDPFGTFGAWVG